jgi:CheY-like chemotaxis protein
LLLDPGRLKQVLYNYVSNALKFTPEGGTVSIRLLPESEQSFRIEVEDTGSGISPENLQRLFVEFQQVHDSREKKGGTGLGLALTKRLVEAQGGTVGVRSTVGKGSTFWAVLPRRVAPSAAAPEAQPAIVNPGAPLVLIVEDDVRDQKHLAGILSEGGYAVEIAATGAAAVELCGRKSFDAIILDILLPDMSGLDVLNQIGEGSNRGVPIIAVTVVAERGAVAGFAVQDVLPKPANAQSLLAALTRAGVAPHKPGTVLLVDDDPGSLKLVATTLNQLGYEVRCEHDGAAGLQAIREVLPSAIILDLIMPGMNGFEFLEHLRREAIGRRVPVIVWTVKDLTPEERAFLRASAQAIVSKGKGSGDVLAELETVLNRKKAA